MNVAAAVKWIAETNVSPSRRCSGVVRLAGRPLAPTRRGPNTAIAHRVPTKSSRTPE